MKLTSIFYFNSTISERSAWQGIREGLLVLGEVMTNARVSGFRMPFGEANPEDVRQEWINLEEQDPRSGYLAGQLTIQNRSAGLQTSLYWEKTDPDGRAAALADLGTVKRVLPVNYAAVDFDGIFWDDEKNLKTFQSFFKRMAALETAFYGDASVVGKPRPEFFPISLQIQGIPPLGWLVYLGKPYVGLIGGDRLMSSPAPKVEEVGQGILIQTARSPRESLKGARATQRHIGKRYFDRGFLRRAALVPKVDYSGALYSVEVQSQRNFQRKKQE